MKINGLDYEHQESGTSELSSYRLEASPQPTVSRAHAHKTSLLVNGVQPFGEYKGNRVLEKIGLSLCSGMSTGLLAMNMVGAMLTRFIAVERDTTRM